MTETWEDDQDRISSSLGTASLSVSEISISLNLDHAALTHAPEGSHPEDENILITELFCTWCDN